MSDKSRSRPCLPMQPPPEAPPPEAPPPKTAGAIHAHAIVCGMKKAGWKSTRYAGPGWVSFTECPECGTVHR